MTEEIKKIFYKLRSDEYYKEHYQQSVYYERDLKKLENYITNLQKERDIYKQRNEKAIEYNYKLQEKTCHQALFDEPLTSEIYSIAENNINILEGGDE